MVLIELQSGDLRATITPIGAEVRIQACQDLKDDPITHMITNERAVEADASPETPEQKAERERLEPKPQQAPAGTPPNGDFPASVQHRMMLRRRLRFALRRLARVYEENCVEAFRFFRVARA